MENKESPRPRRPLPVPKASKSSPAQRPNTPIDESIPPSSFYTSGTQGSQPLPSRPANVGSGNTLAHFMPPDHHSKDYREPELVTNQDDDGDSIPPLTEPTDTGGGWTTEEWSRDFDLSAWNNGGASSSWNNNFSGGGYYSKDTADVPISGRSECEENNWWDADVRTANKRPGPGMLPPILLDELHDSDHSLFSVSVTNPDVHPPRQPSENTNTPSPTPSAASGAALYTVPPSQDEVRTSVPHPNAYYCPKENGWVILSWKSSSITPPLACSFEDCDHLPLPDQARRKQAVSCIGDDGIQLNKTHHFHKYFKAIDALKLTPPLKVDDWEVETARAKRKKDAVLESEDTQSRAEEGKLLDLYVCCQCSFYCVASDLISGVIPRKHLDNFIKDKRSSPLPGKTGEQAVVIALETIMLYVARM